MAVGRVGGTRSKVSGKVGDDVYTVRRESNGSYSQVVSPLPETREDTLTPSGVRQRIRMSMIYKYMHVIPQIVTESFGDKMSKPLNLQEFVRQNIDYIMSLEESGSSLAQLPYYYDYGDTNLYPCPLRLSIGPARQEEFRGAGVQYSGGKWLMQQQMGSCPVGYTIRQYLKHFNLVEDEVIVKLGFLLAADPTKNTLLVNRFILKPSLSLDTEITLENYASLYIPDEGNVFRIIARHPVDSDNLILNMILNSDDVGDYPLYAADGIIKSQLINGLWERSTSHLSVFGTTGWMSQYRKTLEDVWDSWYTDRL